MLIEAADTISHFFLVGPRVPPGGLWSDAEDVATLIIRNRISAGGAMLEPGDVLTEDEPFNPADPAGPFRFEAEIAGYKPEPDVVAINAAPTPLPPPLPAPQNTFGTISIQRAGMMASGPNIDRSFDWLPRTDVPRLGLAGQETPPPADGSTLAEFDAEAFALPRNYSNAFQNGQPVPGEALFTTGDQINFNPIAGPARNLLIPAAPQFETRDAEGTPLAAPPEMLPRVDTVVLDVVADEFTLIWRTVFVWETRFETATLEVLSDG